MKNEPIEILRLKNDRYKIVPVIKLDKIAISKNSAYINISLVEGYIDFIRFLDINKI